MTDVLKELQAYLDGDNSVVMSKRLLNDIITEIESKDERIKDLIEEVTDLEQDLREVHKEIRNLERTIIMGERG